MNRDQHQMHKLLRQIRSWAVDMNVLLDVARHDHWLNRHNKGALIDDLRRLADRLEKADAKREDEAA